MAKKVYGKPSSSSKGSNGGHMMSKKEMDKMHKSKMKRGK